MKMIFPAWNFMRMLRLLLGTAVMVQGILARDTIAIILGVAFAGMAAANIGCCGARSCAAKTDSTTHNKKEDIHYEEVVSNK